MTDKNQEDIGQLTNHKNILTGQKNEKNEFNSVLLVLTNDDRTLILHGPHGLVTFFTSSISIFSWTLNPRATHFSLLYFV